MSKAELAKQIAGIESQLEALPTERRYFSWQFAYLRVLQKQQRDARY